MVGMLLMVLAGIAGRALALRWRGTDMYAGYAWRPAASWRSRIRFKRGEHIRVSLLLQAAHARGAAGTGDLVAVRGRRAGWGARVLHVG